MSLTVADLALAIGKDENYVRQHIRRQNLQARKDGRRVIVEEADAATWAKERGLPFIQAIRTLDLDEESSTRAARMTVLAIQGTDGTSTNVFTLIRHRDSRSLGPWEKEENLNWYSDRVIVENAGETKSLTVYRCRREDGKVPGTLRTNPPGRKIRNRRARNPIYPRTSAATPLGLPRGGHPKR